MELIGSPRLIPDATADRN